MSIETLLSRLDGVKETGHGKYVACCPAHDDSNPSLGITECDDGRILLHDFAGCETEDVLSAVGLTFSDVMPERIGNEFGHKPVTKIFDASQVMAALAHELTVVSILAERYATAADESDATRLYLAASRINTALSLASTTIRFPKLKSVRRTA